VRGSLKYWTRHRTALSGYIFTSEKLVQQQYELRPINGTPTNFNGFRVLAALLHGWASSTLCGVNRGRHLY